MDDPSDEQELVDLIRKEFLKNLKNRLANGEATSGDLAVIRQYLRDTGLSLPKTQNDLTEGLELLTDEDLEDMNEAVANNH